MLETAYVVTWRWSDGSGSGAIAAFVDKARADRLVEVLAADQCSRSYKIEAVPFDSADGVAAPLAGKFMPGAIFAWNCLESTAAKIEDREVSNTVREFLMRAWHHEVLPAVNAADGVDACEAPSVALVNLSAFLVRVLPAEHWRRAEPLLRELGAGPAPDVALPLKGEPE